MNRRAFLLMFLGLFIRPKVKKKIRLVRLDYENNGILGWAYIPAAGNEHLMSGRLFRHQKDYIYACAYGYKSGTEQT